jgi:hypothetical protein
MGIEGMGKREDEETRGWETKWKTKNTALVQWVLA